MALFHPLWYSATARPLKKFKTRYRLEHFFSKILEFRQEMLHPIPSFKRFQRAVAEYQRGWKTSIHSRDPPFKKLKALFFFFVRKCSLKRASTILVSFHQSFVIYKFQVNFIKYSCLHKMKYIAFCWSVMVFGVRSYISNPLTYMLSYNSLLHETFSYQWKTNNIGLFIAFECFPIQTVSFFEILVKCHETFSGSYVKWMRNTLRWLLRPKLFQNSQFEISAQKK